jgi:hypothetical protein
VLGLARTVAFLGVFAFALPALAVGIEVDCERLGDKDAEELSARARLTVRDAKKLPKSLLFACDVDRAEVVWNGPPLELIRVKNEGNLLEAFLDALELRVTGKIRPKKSRVPKPTPGETPEWDPKAAPEPKSPPAGPNGGFGAGVTSHFVHTKLTPMIGPRLDVAIGQNPFVFQIWESARLGSARDEFSAFMFDLGAGAGWGAPFNAGYPVGAVLGLGVEWFSLDSSTQASGYGTAGLRGAVTLEPLSLWLGVDGRMRFARQRYGGAQVDITLPRYDAMLSIGVVLLVESGWKIPTRKLTPEEIEREQAEE